MLKTLVKKQLMEIFRGYFYNAKTNERRSKGATAAFIVFFAAVMIVVIGGMFFGMSLALCAPLAQAGMSWLYFAVMSLMAVFLGAFGSVFNTYAGLYAAKDNDLLLSLPIPVRTLMASRLLGVYLMGLMYSAVVIVPAVVVYWMRVSAAPRYILGGLLLTALISLFVLTLSCALGWVVAKVNRRLKRKSFITVIISLAGIAVYYFFVFKAQTALETLVANAALYGEKVKGAAHPLYLVGCVGTGDGRAMLLVTLAVAALFALMWALLAHSFLKLSTATGASGHTVYRERELKRQSADAALFKKELARFTASPNYMLNCGLGILLLPVAGVALVIKGGELLPLLQVAFGERGGCAEVLLCAGVCTIAAMNDMATPSVSLEGKNLWLAQSLPLTPWQVLRAKLKVQLALTVIPALVPLVCMAFVLPLTPALPLIFITALSYIAFSACLGLTLGVMRANLTWTNELAPIKQSLAVMIAMFGGWAYALLLAGLYLLLGWRIGAASYLALFSAATLAAAAILLKWLRTKGAQRFAAL